MCEPTRRSRSRRAEAGVSLVEMSVFLMVMVPLMVAMTSTVKVFTESTAAGHHRTAATTSAQTVLQRITAELSLTSSRIDHPLLGYSNRPHDPTQGIEISNSSYNVINGGTLPVVGEMFDTFARDGTEYFHPLTDVVPGTGGFGLDPVRVYANRRLFIYRTYEPFDTIEFQKVRTPRDQMNHISGGSVSQPWSARRKIFLEGGRVLLRVDLGDPLTTLSTGPFRTAELGNGVEKLEFHLNQAGHIIVRISSASGEVLRDPEGAASLPPPTATSPYANATGHAPWLGARSVSQVVINPRNGLF